MAKMIPADPVPGSPESEAAVFESLRKLDDSWTVIHSVRWQALRGRRQGDGEADFVLVHRRHGLIVLEVKGGGIHIQGGVWHTTNRAGVTSIIKSPFEQAVASKHALVSFLRDTFAGGDRISVCHAVVLPDIEVDAPLGLDAPIVLTIDRRRLRDAPRAIAGVVSHWNAQSDVSEDKIDRIVARLRPTLEIRTLLSDTVREANHALLKLTAEQIGVLGGMRRNRRAVVLGGAGTGKTVLAIEKAREFSAAGLTTLLTCFNEPLAAASARALKDSTNVTVRNFHSICVGAVRGCGLQVPDPIPDDWWTTSAADMLVAAMERGSKKYDAIVVDEGQDFSADWITALMLSLSQTDDAPFYVFLDSHQDLYVRGCQYPPAWPTFELTKNCRNTLPIGRRVASVYGDVVETLGVAGPEPKLELLDSESKLLSRAQHVVELLVEKEGMAPSQIVVLCGTRALAERLRTMAVADHVFCNPGDRGIAVDTVWRFKGLESDVALLVLPEMQVLSEEQIRSILYVGMSRPRVILHVLAARSWRTAPGFA